MVDDLIPTTFNLSQFGFGDSSKRSSSSREVAKRKVTTKKQTPTVQPRPQNKERKSRPLRPKKPRAPSTLPKVVEIRTKEQLTTRQADLYRRLYIFYSGTDFIGKYLLPLRNKQQPQQETINSSSSSSSSSSSPILSLRTVNYLVTTYAHMIPIRYVVDGVIIDIAASYDNELLQHTKKLFDPFRRHWRIWWELPNGEKILTTLAQLNFFRWAIRCRIFDWADQHRADIERHMKMRPPPTPRNVVDCDTRQDGDNGTNEV